MTKVGGAKLIAVLIVSALQLGASHSWLHCLDAVEDPSTTPDKWQCNGYPRCWGRHVGKALGTDVGCDRRPGRPVPAGLFCNNAEKTPSSSNVAQVWPGKEIWLTWPAKNHAATQQAGNVEFFIAKAPGVGEDFSHISSVNSWVAKYPGLQRTFSNCVPNKSGVDRAPCSGKFKLPDDLQKGTYTVMWWWEFNPGEFYNSCADMQVGDKPPAPTPAPPPPPGPKPDPCAWYSTPPETKAMSICPGENGDDCSRHHDCCGGGTKCYYKSNGTAGCLKACPGPGYINPDDPPAVRTPWECTDFSPAPAPVGLKCDGDGGNRRRRNDDDNDGECCKCPTRRRRSERRRRRRRSSRRRSSRRRSR